MPLIASISGIRGTFAKTGDDNLTPDKVVKYTAAFGAYIKNQNHGADIKIVIGRDARESGEVIRALVADTLVAAGFTVLDLGLAATPTVELAVITEQAQGGIIITASHNPGEWNALKFLNSAGEFLSASAGQEILRLAQENIPAGNTGSLVLDNSYNQKHIASILQLPLVDREAIIRADFAVAVDGINSVGGIIIPQLLEALGVKNIFEINCQANGRFTHNPEPLEKNLGQLSKAVVENRADLGLAVDPDVDRLAFISQNGQYFGEEYTLVAVADYTLKNYSSSSGYQKNTVSNLSSSRALKDVAKKYDGNYFASAIGEINVVEKMKEQQAVIGGEGNGGVIYPPLHFGRDALVGTALFLSALAHSGQTMTEFRKGFPEYYLVKERIDLNSKEQVEKVLALVKERYRGEKINDLDGIKIDWSDSWAHLRPSNTEPIMRLYVEAKSQIEAEAKAGEIKKLIFDFIFNL